MVGTHLQGVVGGWALEGKATATGIIRNGSTRRCGHSRRRDAAGILDHHGRCRRLSRSPRSEAAHGNPRVIRDDLARNPWLTVRERAPSVIRIHHG